MEHHRINFARCIPVSVLAQTGLSFDLSTASGKLMRTMMAGLAEFERDLIRERVSQVSPPPGPAAWRSAGNLASGPPTRRPSVCLPCTAMGCPIGLSVAMSGFPRIPSWRS